MYPYWVFLEGMASPTADTSNLCGSLVEFLASTTNVISPGVRRDLPLSLGISLHPAGIMLETLTRLQCCMPASLSANSKDWSCSLCLPTTFVRKKCFGITPLVFQRPPLLAFGRLKETR